jgi:hypothetical protein
MTITPSSIFRRRPAVGHRPLFRPAKSRRTFWRSDLPTGWSAVPVGALLFDGEVDHTMRMAIDGERIAAIYIIRNPDKLRHVPIAVRH